MKIKKILKYFGIAIAILVGGFLIAGQIAYYNVPMIDAPGKMYSVDGTEIHMYCTGSENDTQPTIIIISGGGTPSYVYDDLRENLSKTIRTCSYDIAGFGWSKPNDLPLTVKNMSDELHLLLQTAQIDGPIILAGHSLGGLVSLIYSAEHEEQVAGIAFIDSSHYNQVDYFGKEFSELSDKQTEEFLANFWLVELGSRLGIMNLMDSIFASSYSEQHREDHAISASLHRWNPPYAGMKSVIANLNLSFEQAKEAHYDRGDLPIISISASDIALGGERPKGFSDQDLIDAQRFIHKDLAELSSNGKHVIVNGTAHMSIVYNDETADHILSIIPENTRKLFDKAMIDKYKNLPEKQTVEIPLDETFQYEDLELHFFDIEDSRCPLDVICVWEGEANVMISLRNQTHKISGKFTPDYTLSYITPYKVTLIDVQPHPISTEKPDYIATLEISKLVSTVEANPTLDDFRNILSEFSNLDAILSNFGEPNADIGSGIHIYVYDLNDHTQIWIGYADTILYVRHVDDGGNILENLL